MKTSVTQVLNLSPKQLAESLAKAEPSEFAQFWLEFSSAIEKYEPIELHEFAKAMAPSQGSNRKNILFKLIKLINYYEVQGVE